MKNAIKDQTYAFALLVVTVYKKLSPADKISAGTQFFKSGTSIGANYREAEFAQSRADFINKLSIARKECNECIYWLDLLHECGFIDLMDYTQLSKQAKSLLKLLTAIIQTTRSNTPKPTPRPIHNL